MKFSNIEVSGFEAALRSMREQIVNPGRSDSHMWLPNEHQEEYLEIIGDDIGWEIPWYIGEEDKNLIKDCINDGRVDFLKIINVSFEVTCPIYMTTLRKQRLINKPITLDCFEQDNYEELSWKDSAGFMEEYNSSFLWDTLIDGLESLRKKYIETNDEKYIKELLRLLPMSYSETVTICKTYAELRDTYQKSIQYNNVFSEYDKYQELIETLPYSELLLIDSWDDQKE